jgi:acyl-CoA reductase-like NAD-dependent aldehyde dehydrogenase
VAQKIKNYIDGKWVEAAHRKTFESRNPADHREVIGVVPDSDASDVEKGVEAARRAFGPWAATPAPKRGEILYRAAELLVKRKEALGKLVCREMGKVLSESLGDVQEAIDMTYYMAGEGRRLSGQTVPSELPDKDAKSVRVPIGVCAQITPWNFPIAIPSWKITPALIAGNTIVFKPAEETPVCAARFVEILHEAGLPPGVLNMVHGFGPSVGEPLVRHPGVDAVSFTGSNEVGERIAAICGSTHKHFTMETGGKNPIIIMDDADLDLALEGALWGGFGTSGQRCTAASRLIVHDRIHDRFVKAFSERAARLTLGNGLDKKTEVGPVVSEAQQQRILGYIEIGKKEGAKLILGGIPYRKGKCARGYFIEPTIFVDVGPKMRIAQEEIFGPVVSILRAGNLKQAIDIANDVPFGLSAAIYSRDVNNTAVAEKALDTGLVYINASTIGAEIQLPFGGTKRTGLGPREAGGRGGALDLYTKWKVIYRDFSGRLQKAQIDKE